jgi:hypothetical protein
MPSAKETYFEWYITNGLAEHIFSLIFKRLIKILGLSSMESETNIEERLRV